MKEDKATATPWIEHGDGILRTSWHSMEYVKLFSPWREDAWEGDPEAIANAALIEAARIKRLWLWCRYQDLWFSPDELKAANDDGRFIWSAVNWEMRSPAEHIEEMDRKIDALTKARDAFIQRVALKGRTGR